MSPQTLYIISATGLVWFLILSYSLIRLFLHYQRLTQGSSKKDLISSLNRLIGQTKENQAAIEVLKESLQKEKQANKKHFQKLGFKRFNPFTDTGGNQSFILSLLDENSNGFVVSSLHSRENTRIYAKAIDKGKTTDQQLSKEEQEVIKLAQKAN